MNRILKILFSMFLGAWAGLIAWAILDLLIGRQTFDRTLGAGTTIAIYGTEAITGALVGLLAGMVITGLEAWNNSSKILPTVGGGLIGIIAGLLGGMLGLLIAEVLFQNISLSGDLIRVARVAGWALFGLGVGIAPGIATWSARKTLASSIGGLIGGILGGLALTLLASLANFPMMG